MSASETKSDSLPDQTASSTDRSAIILGFGTLGCGVEANGQELHVTIPEEERSFWGGQAELRLDGEVNEKTLAKLWERVAAKTGCVHAAPADQPVQVHQLAQYLFAPYEVEGGQTHLAGCTLDPRPFLRLSVSDDGQPFHDENAQEISTELRERLGLNDLVYYTEGAAILSRDDVAAWIASISKDGEKSSSNLPLIAWCRYASGKLAFEIGEEEVSLPFEGWARDIVSGKTRMPPYRCPLSGRESYHLVADDNGRITVAEAIAVCEVSGRRVVETDLEICQETGRRALKEHLATCEQTHRRVLRSALQTCDMCRRQLASVSLSKGRCEPCRHLTPVSKDDPTLARLLHQYEKLDAWNRWRIGETSKLFIFTAASWTQKLLLVVDKHSLEVHRLATRSRWGNHWVDAPPKLREELTS